MCPIHQSTSLHLNSSYKELVTFLFKRKRYQNSIKKCKKHFAYSHCKGDAVDLKGMFPRTCICKSYTKDIQLTQYISPPIVTCIFWDLIPISHTAIFILLENINNPLKCGFVKENANQQGPK